MTCGKQEKNEDIKQSPLISCESFECNASQTQIHGLMLTWKIFTTKKSQVSEILNSFIIINKGRKIVCNTYQY